MESRESTDYRAGYRRVDVALPMLVGVVIVFALAVTGALMLLPGRNAEDVVLVLAGLTVLSLFAIMFNVFRVHRWTLGPAGLAIEERPLVPLTGGRRTATVRFVDIVALRDVQSGLDMLLEILARDGARYRMAQAMITVPGQRVPRPDPQAPLAEFAQTIRAAATRAGVTLPATSQGLSFWNTGPGLGFQLFLLLLSLAISGVVVFALVEGFSTRQHRGGETMGILLLLPVGAFLLLRKSLRRRRAVLASLAQNAGSGAPAG